MARIAICFLSLICVAGCEHLKRNGQPGDPGYIAPDYRTVEVVLVEPGWIKELSGGKAQQPAYTIVEDDRKRRFVIAGVIGKDGEKFEMDVSLKTPVERN